MGSGVGEAEGEDGGFEGGERDEICRGALRLWLDAPRKCEMWGAKLLIVRILCSLDHRLMWYSILDWWIDRAHGMALQMSTGSSFQRKEHQKPAYN